jgi:hypothetical protein
MYDQQLWETLERMYNSALLLGGSFLSKLSARTKRALLYMRGLSKHENTEITNRYW